MDSVFIRSGFRLKRSASCWARQTGLLPRVSPSVRSTPLESEPRRFPGFYPGTGTTSFLLRVQVLTRVRTTGSGLTVMPDLLRTFEWKQDLIGPRSSPSLSRAWVRISRDFYFDEVVTSCCCFPLWGLNVSSQLSSAMFTERENSRLTGGVA